MSWGAKKKCNSLEVVDEEPCVQLIVPLNLSSSNTETTHDLRVVSRLNAPFTIHTHMFNNTTSHDMVTSLVGTGLTLSS